jgi:DNA-binding transcriptional regulator YdaS (Cro superfamily)
MATKKVRTPAAAIQAYLEKNGVSQQTFAQQLGVSQSLVAQWIKGRARPTPKLSPEIIRVTGGEVSREMLFPELFAERAA